MQCDAWCGVVYKLVDCIAAHPTYINDVDKGDDDGGDDGADKECERE